MKLSEHQIQAAFIEWKNLVAKTWPVLELGFAVPNGGLRNVLVAKKLKAEGVVSGIPDWILPIARRGYVGLAVEFKIPGGRLSINQQKKIELMRSEGWGVYVLSDWEEAAKVVEWYVTGSGHGLAAIYNERHYA